MFFFKYDFLIYWSDFIINNNYKNIKILKKNIKFFIPNELIKWRIKTYFTKEPETLEWIDSFKINKDIIFWDIGANIGLYSIYSAIKHKKINVYSFEPSTSNLRTLSRNISINNLYDKINIVPFALSNKENKFLNMIESDFTEGGALHSFGEKFDFEGNSFKSSNQYKTFGTSIEYLLKNKIIPIPNYIKIDVDGIEHLILSGAGDFLNNQNIESIAVEVNENFKSQFSGILEVMKKYNFILIHKKNNGDYKNKFSKSYNYLFERPNL